MPPTFAQAWRDRRGRRAYAYGSARRHGSSSEFRRGERDSVRIALATVGTSGDVNPFVGLGQALRARGHDVWLLTNPHFAGLVERCGLPLLPLGTETQYLEAMAHADSWHPTRGYRVFLSNCLTIVEQAYEHLTALAADGPLVVAASPMVFGARIAQEKHDLRMATIFPNPILLPSVYAPPKLHLMPIPDWIGPWGARLLFRIGEAKFDSIIQPALNAARARLGLPRARQMWKHWRNSPDRIIGLWPEWLYPRQADWPAQAVTTGFVEFDGAATTPSHASRNGAWRHELAPHDVKPIVFTAGTGMCQGHRFFSLAADACRRLNRPGLLLTERREQVPEHLPEGVRHVAYAPFGELLPHAAALVHHGGIGTAARGMKAALPQLILPLSFDQYDNAFRLSQLGVAASIEQRLARPETVAGRLADLLGSQLVRTCCEHYAAKLAAEDGTAATCDLIERLAPAPAAAIL